jgi:hypothetical protein
MYIETPSSIENDHPISSTRCCSAAAQLGPLRRQHGSGGVEIAAERGDAAESVVSIEK